MYANSCYVGWVSITPHYCQLIRDVNKVKRLQWCRQYADQVDKFENVIWSDECSVQIDTSRKCSWHVGQPKPLRPKPKHPAKVHIWGTIAMKGATSIVIFTETLIDQFTEQRFSTFKSPTGTLSCS